MTDLLEHIYSLSLTKNRKACWKDICCKVYLEQLRIRDKDLVINESIRIPSTRETLLLKLTIIQKLFSRAQDYSCAKLLELCNLVVNDLNLLDDLLHCLHSEDQLIAFSASKALSNVLVVLPLTSKNKMWFYTFLDVQTLKTETCPWRLLYTFPVISHLFHCYHSNISSPEDKTTCVCQSSSGTFNDGNARTMTVLMVSYVLRKLESLIFVCVPLWKEFRNLTKILSDSVDEKNKTVENESGQFHDLCVHIHEEKINHCPIQPWNEDVFLALLTLLAEVLKCVATSAQKGNITDLTEGSSTDTLSFTSNKFREDVKHQLGEVVLSCSQTGVIDDSANLGEAVCHSKVLLGNSDSYSDIVSNLADPSLMCKIFPLLVHYLHIKQLSHITFKKIIDVTGQVLAFAGGSSVTDVEGSSESLEKVAMVTARSFISIFSCCIWENLPRCEGFIGFGGRNVEKPLGFSESGRNNECVDSVALRKVSLVLLRTLALLSNCEMSKDSVQVIREITGTLASWTENLREAVSKITQCCAENDGIVLCERESNEQNLEVALFDLFSDQDDELVEMLLLLLKLYQKLQESKRTENATTEPQIEDTMVQTVCHQINPHTFFVNFLQTVCFDHSVILDFLVSSETVFLSYLVSYLRCILTNWSAFVYSHKTSSADRPCETDYVQLTSEEEEGGGGRGDIFENTDESDIQRDVDDLKSPASFGTCLSTVKNAMPSFARPKSDDEHNCEVSNFISPNSVILCEREDAGLKHKGDSEQDVFNTKPELICSAVVAGRSRMRTDKMCDMGRLGTEKDRDKITASSGALALLSMAYDDDDDDYDASYSDSCDGDHEDDASNDSDDDYGNGVGDGDGDGDDGDDIYGHGGGGIDDADGGEDGKGEDEDDYYGDDDDGDDNDGHVGDGIDDDDGGGDDGRGDDVGVDDDGNGKDDYVDNGDDDKVGHVDGDYDGDSYGDGGGNDEGEDEEMQFTDCRHEKLNCFVDGGVAATNCVTTSSPPCPEEAKTCSVSSILPRPIEVTDTVPRSLEKTMSVLIRLRLSIERLAAVGLFPYSPEPLLRLLERVELFYDGC